MDNFFGSDTGDETSFFDSHPSYMVAADSHSIGNNQGSMLDPENWGEAVNKTGMFMAAATARAVTSAWNTVPEVGSWFGADTDAIRADTQSILSGFDDNLGAYYGANKSSIDIVGDVAGSIVPGMAGIKVLHWGQQALKLIPEGKAGFGLARSIGMLPDTQTRFAKQAAESMAKDPHTFSWVNSNTLKSVAAGYGQQALEFGMFDAVAASTMRSSPLFQDHDASDIMYNALIGGGVIGGGVMGTIAAVKTYGSIKRSLVATDAALNPYKAIKGGAEATLPADNIIILQHDLEAVAPILPTDPLAAVKAAELVKRKAVINNEIRTSAQVLTGKDAELGNVVADSLRGVDAKTGFQNLAGAREVVRALDKTDIEKAAEKAGVPSTTRWVKLHGEDAGAVYTELPKGLNIADKFKGTAAIEAEIARYKFSATKIWDILAASPAEAEARYIKMRSLEELPKNYKIDPNDIPLLERALELQVPDITLSNGKIVSGGSDLLKYIEDTKNHVAQLRLAADELTLTKGAVPLNTADLAKLTNTRVSYQESIRNADDRAGDLFAMQSNVRDTSKRYIEQELTFDPAKQVPTYMMPQYAKIAYDTSAVEAINNGLIDGAAHIKQVHLINQQHANVTFANFVRSAANLFLDTIPDSLLSTANRMGAGATAFSAASAGYNTLAGVMEYIGKGTATLKSEAAKTIELTFQSHAYKIKNTPKLGLEFATLRQQMLSTPEKYVVRDGKVMLRKLSEWEDEAEAAAEAGEKFTLARPLTDHKGVPDSIPVSKDLENFLLDWVSHNDEKLAHKEALLVSKGKQVSQRLSGNLYFPQPNPKDYKHFAMVFDPSVTGTGHKSLITAATDDELQQLIKKVPPEFKVKLKSEIEAEKKAKGIYEFDMGINENYIDTALKRNGVAPFFPKMDASSLMDDMLTWRTQADVNLIRDMVSLKYERQFTELQRMGRQATLESTSTFSGASVRKYAENTVLDPYNNYVKTALDISKVSEYKLWKGANDLAEQAIGGLVNKIQNIWSKGTSETELSAVNSALKEAGINRTFEDASMLAYANHTAPKPALSNFVRGSNSVLSTLMLRADPLNALNNGMGNIVLTGSETQSLIAAISKGDASIAGKLSDIAKVKLPGTGDEVLSSTKLISSAYSNWFKALRGEADEAAFRKFYKDQGWSTSLHDQMKSILDNVTLTGNETTSQLTAKLSAAAKGAGDFASKWTGNNFAEEMNRFIASDVARQLTTLGREAGVLTADEQKVFINSFVNRTQGNYLASQRPIAFQGPIGQAIGLFQTYQFNMLHHIFRKVETGETKNLAILLGLQGTIYGANGLPGFNAINDHLVGNAAGNTSHNDIVSTTFNAAGKEGGDWLLYGMSSNFLLHPDLKMNMYSRGDINPRQATVIPTTISEVPAFGAAAKLFTSLKDTGAKIGAGGDIYTSVLQGIEHSGINRPLAGLASVLEGGSTTSKGSLIVSNDLLSLSNFSRILGAKPLDEAIARDGLYRVKVYGANRTEQINTIGAAIRTKVLAGETPTADEVNGFMQDYIKAGGSQHNFSKFMGKTMMNAKASQVNVLSQNLKNPFSQYMQSVMGGYKLQDLNTGGEE